ncbi:hypothetical protein MRX96_018686 [Rhipicephalus microplus]
MMAPPSMHTQPLGGTGVPSHDLETKVSERIGPPTLVVLSNRAFHTSQEQKPQAPDYLARHSAATQNHQVDYAQVDLCLGSCKYRLLRITRRRQ